MKRVWRVGVLIVAMCSGQLHAELAVPPPDTGTQDLPDENAATPENGVAAVFAERLATHIAQHQFYPRPARHRGMQGDVMIAFTLLPDGTVSGLQARGSVHRVLLEAAEKMVQLAQPLPMPLPSEHVVLPTNVEFTVRYRLQEKTEDQ